ncbi:MAG TPA: hypothetical protein V6D35_16465, partial [Candidatus Sericytochromatia bacterium]
SASQDAKSSAKVVGDSVKDTAQEVKPSVTDAVKSASQDAKSSVKDAANSVKNAAQDKKPERDINLHQERRIPDTEVIGTSEVPIGKPIAPPAPPIPAPIEKERLVIEPATPLDTGLPVERPKVDFDKI